MSSGESTVAKPNVAVDAVLDVKAKAAKASPPMAATWSLGAAEPTPPPPESAFAPKLSNGSTETVLSIKDGRKPVDPTTFGPGGKYRSIVKLFSRFENAPDGVWAMGTGWLVRPDVFVTAGHCSCDWSYSYGRAVEVKAYVGYYGNQSKDDPKVEFQSVKRIVTTEGWIKGQGLKPFDVSFMQVNKPFQNIERIKFDDTPVQGNTTIGVVGYPGDLEDASTKEKGAYMYEMFLETQFDLTSQPDHMLQYKIDTFGGNSGSPVFRQEDMVSIGAHVYGGNFNSASVIGGKYGNRYNDYLAVFDSALPTKKTLQWIQMASSGPKTESAILGPKIARNPNPKPVEKNPNTPLHGEAELTGQEGFMDILNVVKTALPIGAELLGGPVGVLAGVALNAAGQLAGKSTESALTSSTIKEGSVERAILAEATMHALKVHPQLEESVLSHIKDTVMKALPTIKKVAPRIAGAALEPALQVALDMLKKYNKDAKSGTEGTFIEPFRPPIHYSEATFEINDTNTEAFLGAVKSSMEKSQQESSWDHESQEGFFDVIKAGVSLVGQGVSAVAQQGLPILANMITQTASGTEALEIGINSETTFRGPLAQRALVADAALSAVTQLDHNELQEAGFFSALTSAVQAIAPAVIKVAPIVANNVLPIIGQLIKKQESAMVNKPNTSTSLNPNPKFQPGHGKKPSKFSFGTSAATAAAAAPPPEAIDSVKPDQDHPKVNATSVTANGTLWGSQAPKVTSDPLKNQQPNEVFFTR